MNKAHKYIVFFMLFVVNITMKAQNLAFYFELIPEAQLPHLKPEMRKGMVGIYELGQRPAKVPNLLGGTCVLDSLTNDYLSMHTSDVSTLSIKMIEQKSDSTSILAVIHTVKTVGTYDSSINFFTNTWSKLDNNKYFSTPTHADFYKQNDTVSLEEFTKYCIPLIIKYEFEGNGIKATIDPEKYLPVEVFEKIKEGVNREFTLCSFAP